MKHAYLIMAHNQLKLLNLLLQCLDHEDNDVIIHLDKKWDIRENEIGTGLKKSRIYFTDRTSVAWAGYSQIYATLLMIKKAREVGHHDFYHMLSGVDLPIKPIYYINDFFEKNKDNNFIHFSEQRFSESQFFRVQYKQFFLEKCGKNKNGWWYINKICIKLQKWLHISNKRVARDTFYVGSALWSIKEELAEYLASNEKEIEGLFRYSLSGDESWVQMMVKRSPYKDSLYVKTCQDDWHGNMRYIDFHTSQGSSPETITEENVQDVLNSDYLFARKFDYERSPGAVDTVINYVMRDENAV